MFYRLALLFVTIPLIELALLTWMSRLVGLSVTLALVIATGILGAALARRQGSAVLEDFRQALDAGRLPHREAVAGILVLLAGAVLLTPGLLTDLTGFALLLPPVRGLVTTRIVNHLKGRIEIARRRGPSAIDVDFDVHREER